MIGYYIYINIYKYTCLYIYIYMCVITMWLYIMGDISKNNDNDPYPLCTNLYSISSLNMFPSSSIIIQSRDLFSILRHRHHGVRNIFKRLPLTTNRPVPSTGPPSCFQSNLQIGGVPPSNISNTPLIYPLKSFYRIHRAIEWR